MGVVSPLLLPLPVSPPSFSAESFEPKPFFLNSYALSKPPSVHPGRALSGRQSVVPLRCTNNGDKPNESRFFDDDGVVDDMDGYLNYLSLEYDSVWETKPAWCQPWTILLTGVTIISGSWILLHSVVISAVISSLIFAWWYIFLYAYPKAHSAMIADRRKRVSSGIEDTFGLGKGQ